MRYTIRGIPAAVDDALRGRAQAVGKSLNEVVVDIPAAVDDALRARARAVGKSLNEVVVDALATGAGVTATPRKTPGSERRGRRVEDRRGRRVGARGAGRAG